VVPNLLPCNFFSDYRKFEFGSKSDTCGTISTRLVSDLEVQEYDTTTHCVFLLYAYHKKGI